MKKILVLATSALVFGGVLASAAPAFAIPTPIAPVPSIADTTIVNGGAFNLTFDQDSVPSGFCVVIQMSGFPELAANPGGLPPVDLPAGTSTPFNSNLASTVVTNSVTVYSVASDCDSERTVISSLTWTVSPALAVVTPADVTVGVPFSQTVASTLNDFSLSPAIVDLSSGAHWVVVPGDQCEAELVLTGSAGTPTAFVALPAGISIDPTVSAAGTVPPLTFSGSATTDEIGSYQLCLALTTEAQPGTPTYASTTLTIVPAAVPAVVVPVLAETGVDSSSLLAGGAAAFGLGMLMLALLRRRKATV
jgi:hypothetical protein